MERGLFPSYFLHLEREGDNRRFFLLAARRRRKAGSSNYVISLDATDPSHTSCRVAGRMKSNFVGTHFSVFGCPAGTFVNTNRSDISFGGNLGKEEVQEIAAVAYVSFPL